MSKDLFSAQAKAYAAYRPTYPRELFDYILSFVDKRKTVWDCATGNGQAAVVLAEYFDKVDATDISEEQIRNAVQKENIHYQVYSAEKTPFADNSFDLITVAQAYHWLNWKAFREEATRVGKPNAVVAVWTYGLLSTDDERLNRLSNHFYRDIVGGFWDAERKYVDDAYKTVDFNFTPLPSRTFEINLQWTKEQFTGYLSSWSAVQHYIKQKNSSPIVVIEKEMNELWNDEDARAISFPVYLRIGRRV
jgi:ubiquinone/menaquinone biosynthesis C-methylase UbiE